MMLPVVAVLLAFLCSLFWSRESLHLENLALRQQLAVYKQMSLGRDCPEPRPVLSADRVRVVAVPDVGGLHHHYERRVA